MSFGRSNSLSLNTGAANSLFSQQSQPASSATPATTGGGLFGNATAQQNTTSGSSLFGGNSGAQNTATTGSSLFGGNTQASSTTGSSLFGKPAQPATSGTSLFGNTTAQPAATGSSLFGGNTQQNTATTGSSLFGNNAQQNTATAGSSLFGNNAAKPATGLGGSLFGGNTQQPAAGGSSLFGASTAQNTNNNTSSLFGKPPGTQQQQPSLFGAAQAASLNQASSLAGRLSMGQNANNTATSAVSAVKIDLDGLRPTTRFEDLTDQMKAELENIDKMIQQQESFCKQIEAILPKHGQDITSLGPDIDFIRDKVDAVEHALASDAQGVDAQRRVAEQDGKDVERCQRIITNLGLPQGYQFANLGYAGGVYGSSSQAPHHRANGPVGHPNDVVKSQDGSDGSSTGGSYDTDLIGNYFLPLASSMQTAMSSYASNLVEIESHMRVIEQSALSQAQRLAQRKAGQGDVPTSSADATVRELADTLRGFEMSILGVASAVGECREGVNELVLGRVNGAGLSGRY